MSSIICSIKRNRDKKLLLHVIIGFLYNIVVSYYINNTSLNVFINSFGKIYRCFVINFAYLNTQLCIYNSLKTRSTEV